MAQIIDSVINFGGGLVRGILSLIPRQSIDNYDKGEGRLANPWVM